MKIKFVIGGIAIFGAGLLTGAIAMREYMRKTLKEEIEDIEAREKVLEDALRKINKEIENNEENINECEEEQNDIEREVETITGYVDYGEEYSEMFYRDEDDDRSDTDVILDYVNKMKQEQTEEIMEEYADIREDYDKGDGVFEIDEDEFLPYEEGEVNIVAQKVFDAMKYDRHIHYDLVEFNYYDNGIVTGSNGDILTYEDLMKYAGQCHFDFPGRGPDEDLIFVVNHRFKLLIEIERQGMDYKDPLGRFEFDIKEEE